MKKFFLTIALALLSIVTFAQTTPNRLVVTLTNGDQIVYNIADIDSLSFDLIEGDVIATPVFNDFAWDGDNALVTTTVTLSESAKSYRIAIVGPNDDISTALAAATLRTDDGEIQLNAEGLVAGETYTIATIAYDKYNTTGLTATTTFTAPAKGAQLPALSIVIPTDFSECLVQKVMYNDTKVAEVCKEYIKEFGEQYVIVYPCDEKGNAILTKGISVADGGTVVWDEETNTPTYTAGNSTKLSTVYLVDGNIIIDAPETTEVTNVEADLLVDKRGGEEISYKIVKIGTQYWLAENLRATKWTDGTAIPVYTSTQGSAWTANTTGAYHIYADDSQNVSIFGLLYSGYAVTNTEKQLAPEGWEIPSIEQWKLVRTYGGPKAENFKSDTDYSWNLGKEGTNINGFNVWAAGYYGGTATGDADDGADAWFWTTDVISDWLTKADTLCTVRVNQTSTNVVLYSSSGHALTFGHSIRCVRKK